MCRCPWCWKCLSLLSGPSAAFPFSSHVLPGKIHFPDILHFTTSVQASSIDLCCLEAGGKLKSPYFCAERRGWLAHTFLCVLHCGQWTSVAWSAVKWSEVQSSTREDWKKPSVMVFCTNLLYSSIVFPYLHDKITCLDSSASFKSSVK